MEKSSKSILYLERLRQLCVETYKAINGLTPVYVSDIFQSSSSSSLFEIVLVHVNTKFISFRFIKYRVQFKVTYLSHSGCKLI